ncbi:MAG: PEGA domain-containing protein [Candidatus Omnitrophica bacterium]|nr:PEGA domain-containing protein [Candidatus Omnitrophota bacterium]
MNRILRFSVLCCAAFLFFTAGLNAQEGFLRVTSVPEGVSVEIAGKSVGKTPLLTVVAPGEHKLKATLSGYEAVTEDIKVVENEVTVVQLTMQKQVQAQRGIFHRVFSGSGNLTVITDWQNVAIYLDGYKLKETPPVTIKDISAGLHTVILVSGDYADSSRVMIQKGKTFVFKKNFEEDKKKLASVSQKTETAVSAAKAAELEKKRQALPAKIVMRLADSSLAETQQQQESSVSLWGEGDLVELAFQYRKSGETAWNLKDLNSKNKREDSLALEKGTYDIQFTATHYKEPKGVLNIFLGAKKEKVREYRESLKHEFKPDIQYTYVITYDGKTDFSYELKEEKLNTPVE